MCWFGSVSRDMRLLDESTCHEAVPEPQVKHSVEDRPLTICAAAASGQRCEGCRNAPRPDISAGQNQFADMRSPSSGHDLVAAMVPGSGIV